MGILYAILDVEFWYIMFTELWFLLVIPLLLGILVGYCIWRKR